MSLFADFDKDDSGAINFTGASVALDGNIVTLGSPTEAPTAPSDDQHNADGDSGNLQIRIEHQYHRQSHADGRRYEDGRPDGAGGTVEVDNVGAIHFDTSKAITLDGAWPSR